MVLVKVTIEEQHQVIDYVPVPSEWDQMDEEERDRYCREATADTLESYTNYHWNLVEDNETDE